MAGYTRAAEGGDADGLGLFATRNLLELRHSVLRDGLVVHTMNREILGAGDGGLDADLLLGHGSHLGDEQRRHRRRFGLKISEGAIANLFKRVQVQLQPTMAEIVGLVRQAEKWPKIERRRLAHKAPVRHAAKAKRLRAGAA